MWTINSLFKKFRRHRRALPGFIAGSLFVLFLIQRPWISTQKARFIDVGVNNLVEDGQHIKVVECTRGIHFVLYILINTYYLFINYRKHERSAVRTRSPVRDRHYPEALLASAGFTKNSVHFEFIFSRSFRRAIQFHLESITISSIYITVITFYNLYVLIIFNIIGRRILY